MSLWPINEYQVGVISSLAWDISCPFSTHTRLWWYSIYTTKYTVNELHNVKDNCYNGAQLNSYEKIGICFLFTRKKKFNIFIYKLFQNLQPDNTPVWFIIISYLLCRYYNCFSSCWIHPNKRILHSFHFLPQHFLNSTVSLLRIQ